MSRRRVGWRLLKVEGGSVEDVAHLVGGVAAAREQCRAQFVGAALPCSTSCSNVRLTGPPCRSCSGSTGRTRNVLERWWA